MGYIACVNSFAELGVFGRVAHGALLAGELSHFASSKAPAQGKFGTLERVEWDESAAKLHVIVTTTDGCEPILYDRYCLMLLSQRMSRLLLRSPKSPD